MGKRRRSLSILCIDLAALKRAHCKWAKGEENPDGEKDVEYSLY